MLLIFQILFSLFSLTAIAAVIHRKHENLLGIRGALFWIVFWVAADSVVWWPHGATLLANQVGIGRGSDFVVYIALALIFFVLFRLHIKIESMNRDITQIVRQEALDTQKDIVKH